MVSKLYCEASPLNLSSLATIVKPEAKTRAEFIEKCRQEAYSDVVVIYRTYYSANITGLIDEELVDVLPESVKFICHSGAGYDQIDVGACSQRQIQVSNAPEVVNNATADTALFLMPGALRGFNQSILSLRGGFWRGISSLPLGHDPDGKTIGILGCGGIGRNIVKKAAAFGMRVIYYNRTKSSHITEAEYVTFDELVRSSDVISICTPLNTNTRHVLSHKEFSMIKQGVVVINTARGPIIDAEALVAALGNGKVWSFGLDVYELEPNIHPDLIAHPRSMLLPHLGTYTIEELRTHVYTHTRMKARCISNVRSALEHGKLRDLVPEQSDGV
ncbi:unnamed protein product [Clonostachys byssicola]|uniref:2-hydroxyacid dehydrogenase n=1 Tax=Clonostachys byssicola TaxID=160290 RepID=A0A9N9UTI5_9HYPO|nr:unnamed protein product [Clonostachys byssicola]